VEIGKLASCLNFVFLVAAAGVRLTAQLPQNPSPMVEHTRTHPRLAEQKPPGRHYSLTAGSLFLPQKLKGPLPPLLVFFHGGSWLPEVSVARDSRMAVITLQAGAGSAVYDRVFREPGRLLQLIAEAGTVSGLRFGPVILGGWSAGCGAIRAILRDQPSYERISCVIAMDGIHAGYTGGKPGPFESQLESSDLEAWLRLARDAVASNKQLLITHSEIFPGTYASTTETADWLIRSLGLKRKAVLEWGPMGTQQLIEVRAGRLSIRGYGGNSAPDHVDQLHSLGEYLRFIRR